MNESQTKRLRDILDTLDETKNKVTVSEFSRFLPLFQKDSALSESNAMVLADTFIRRFNPYENITISNASGEEVAVLPRIFTKVKAIDSAFDDKVARFSKDASSNIPKYANQSTHELMEAIKLTHKNDDKYLKYVNDITEEFHQLVGDKVSNTADEATHNATDDEDGDIQWG